MLPKSWQSCLAAAEVDYEIIVADFQQYYHMDVIPILRHEFRRFAILLLHLPFESRFVQKYCASKDWGWDKEVSSRILQALNVISCQIANMTREKGKPPIKPPEQFQPDYVKKAKQEMENNQRSENALSSDQLKELREFWQARNHEVKNYVD